MGRPQLTGTKATTWNLVTHLASHEREREIETAVAATDPSVSITTFESICGEPDSPTVLVLDDADDDWFTVVADLVAERPGVRPVLLAPVERSDLLLGAVMAGIVGFCDDDASIDAIVRTIDSVRASGVAIPRTMVAPLVAHLRNGLGHEIQTSNGAITITNREWQILILLIKRRTTSEMAEALFVSPGTVRSHVSALLRKLGATDRDDAIRLIASGELELLAASTLAD